MPGATAALALGPAFLDPQRLISTFGLIGILAVVYAESGLLVGFFLPGDSLLFTTGLLVAAGTYLHQPLWLVCLLASVAAVLGDQTGYATGRRFGPRLFHRPDSRLFKQENLAKARDFFDRHGARSVMLARFIPIVRTFTPIVAGAGHMPYRTFLIFNVLGGTLWACGVTVLGYFLGQVAVVTANIEFILPGIVAVSLIPVAVGYLRARRGRQRTGDPGRRRPLTGK